jgi:hypothetical protein
MKTDLENDLVYPIAGEDLEPDSEAGAKAGANEGEAGHSDSHTDSHSHSPGPGPAPGLIPGWGTDLDRNRPRNMQPEEPHPIVEPEPLADQQPTVEILCSTERPGLTPLFGTSVPPSGISGVLRRAAYKQSENDIRRWLMLMFSDRVDVVEGIVEDLREGKIPNIFDEMGWGTEWRYNRPGMVRKAAGTAVAIGLVVYLMRRRSRRAS